jgi:hypothetical protein
MVGVVKGHRDKLEGDMLMLTGRTWILFQTARKEVRHSGCSDRQ